MTALGGKIVLIRKWDKDEGLNSATLYQSQVSATNPNINTLFINASC